MSKNILQSSDDATQPVVNNIISAAEFTPSSADTLTVKKGRKPVLYLVIFILFIASLVLWFLFSAKSVVVVTTPMSTNFTISGNIHIKFNDHLLMQTGNYRLQAELIDHYPIDQVFTVSEPQNQQKNFTFTPLPGQLKLSTNINSDTDVDIFIDGKVVTHQQGLIDEIAAGEHEITVAAVNYFDSKQLVNIVGKRQLQTLAVKLEPAWADVFINSEPIGAKVYNNKKLLGITPITSQLLAGEQQLSFEKEGYQNRLRKVSVVAGQEQTLARIKMFRLTGKLSLTSQPNGVSVTFGDQYLGTTPLSVAVIPDKKQTLLLFKDGFQSQTTELLIASGSEVIKKVKLQQIVAQVNFQVIPHDALLYVEDRLMGRANQKIFLPSKQQVIRIEKEGYVSYQKTILPNPDVDQVFTVKMKTLEEQKWENIKPIITTASGSKLKLFKANDLFVMGASRREQGRRANEVKRTVKITKPFYLGMTEISNKEFKQFYREHSSGHVKGNSLNGTHQPVVNITWQQAALFCNWLSIKENLSPVYQIENNKLVSFNLEQNGYRLPTEAEWVWASRLIDGEMVKFSWGKALPPVSGAGNFADSSGAPILGITIPQYNDSYVTTAPIGSFNQNEKGLFDLAGNVAEWLHDFYQINTGLSLKTEQDPIGPLSGDYHVIRGSSWAHGSQTELRLSFRDYGNQKRNDVGFRIARYVN